MMEGKDYYPRDDTEDLIDNENAKTWKDQLRKRLTSTPARFCYLGVLCLSLGLLIPMWYLYFYPLDFEARVYTRGSCMIAPQYRFPCLVGKENITMLECAESGCCWYDDSRQHAASRCFHSWPASYTFKVAKPALNKTFLHSELNAYSYRDKVAGKPAQTTYGTPQYLRATAQVWCPEHDHAVVQIGPALETSGGNPVILDGELQISSNIGKDFDFYATVKRNSTGRTLMDTRMGATMLSDLYSEVTVKPASGQIYGLGQAFHPSLLRNASSQIRTALYTRPLVFAEGFHPFYMCIEPDGLTHGVYLETTAPVEVQLLGGPTITFRILDSKIKLHVFAGPTPAEVSEQYTRLIGRPILPSFWTLGFHMCRQGDPESFEDVIETMVNRSIPFESDCVDADAFVPLGFEVHDDIKDTFQQRIQELHDQDRKFLAVMLPHLPLEKEPMGSDMPEDYRPYLDASSAKILIETFNKTQEFFGEIHRQFGNKTWNVSYVDYTNPATSSWLNPLVTKLQNDYAVDGYYLMENTPSNNAMDDCRQDKLPFVPNLSESFHTLSNHSICISTEQYLGSHLILHNRYGQDHARAMRAAASTSGSTNMFITSQSTSPGSGAVGGQMAASLTADWTSMALALIQNLELGLYGIPQSGYPICGSRNSTQITTDDVDGYEDRIESLCLLWYQISPYLPLALSYYEAGHFPRNPPQFNEAFLNQVKVHISQRYVFLPYHYTLLVEASRNGAPPLRALWYEFPEDSVTWGIDKQLLLGSALMVAPSLAESQQEVMLYLPGQCWYEYFQGSRPKINSGAAWVTLPVPSQQTLIYQRAATAIFNQDPHTTTELQRKNGTYSVTVALSCEGNYTADGILWLPGDDATISPAKIELTVRNSTVTISSGLDERFCDYYDQRGYISSLEQIKIFGILEDIGNMTATLTDRNGNSDVHVLAVNQNNRPPSLLIADLPIDWCRYVSTVIEWMYS